MSLYELYCGYKHDKLDDYICKILSPIQRADVAWALTLSHTQTHSGRISWAILVSPVTKGSTENGLAYAQTHVDEQVTALTFPGDYLRDSSRCVHGRGLRSTSSM